MEYECGWSYDSAVTAEVLGCTVCTTFESLCHDFLAEHVLHALFFGGGVKFLISFYFLFY